jgi:hypothetical protein
VLHLLLSTSLIPKDYIFANGCRAPPWRQIYGELAYIQVQPIDKEIIIVTASKSGYFINKGYVADETGKLCLNSFMSWEEVELCT